MLHGSGAILYFPSRFPIDHTGRVLAVYASEGAFYESKSVLFKSVEKKVVNVNPPPPYATPRNDENCFSANVGHGGDLLAREGEVFQECTDFCPLRCGEIPLPVLGGILLGEFVSSQAPEAAIVYFLPSLERQSKVAQVPEYT